MLDRPEVDVGLREEPAEVGRQIPALGEPEDRLQRIGLAQPRIVTSVEELQRLHDELDLADTAPAQLDVRGLLAPGPKPAGDPPLPRAHRWDDPLVEARTVHPVARQGLKAGPHPEIAGGDARLDECLPLPELGALLVV